MTQAATRLIDHPLAAGAPDLAAVVEDAIERGSPGSQTEALVLREHKALTRYTSRSIHQAVEDMTTRLWIRSWLDGGAGWAFTTDTSREGIKEVVGRAENAARNISGSRIDLPGTVASGSPAFFESTASLDASARTGLATSHIDRAGNVEVNGNIRVSLQDLALANSTGLRARIPMSYVALIVVAREPGGATWYETAIGRDFAALDFDKVVDDAVAGATLAAQPREVAAADYRVILDDPAVSMLLATLGYVGLNAFGAGAVRDQSSFLAHHDDDPVAANIFTLRDDPLDEEALFSPFDAEGSPRRPLDIIAGGKVAGHAHDRASAAAAGAETTGHALPASMKTPSPLSLSIPAGDRSRDQLVADLGDGLIVHRIHPFISLRGGPNANLSGTSRDGVLVVENGEVVGAAKNVRWSNDMTDLFGSVEGMSEERSVQWMDLPDHAPITNHVPSLLCGRFTVHGSQPRL